jgi:DNA-binding SARP family transcriptional activator
LPPAAVPADRVAEPFAGGAQPAVPLRIVVLGPPRVFWTPRHGSTVHGCVGAVMSPAAASATAGSAARAEGVGGATAGRPVGGPAAGEWVEREVTGQLQPRTRELLVLLAVHPEGVTREALVAALWPASPPARTTNALNTAFSRLRRALSAATATAVEDIVLTAGGRFRLDPDLVDVDYARFATASTARRAAGTDTARHAAHQAMIDSYTGVLADGLSTEWIETARESIRRDALEAVAALARALVATDPEQTLDLLETARAFDPHNEVLYRDIMRLQGRLGRPDAVPRTLSLLATRLAELGDKPSAETADLADRLSRLAADTARSQPGSPAAPPAAAPRRSGSPPSAFRRPS